MAPKSEFVDWPTYDTHLEDAKEGYERLDRLDAEVLGDKQTGRPSLRQELIGKLNQSRNVQIAILVAILTRIVVDWMRGAG